MENPSNHRQTPLSTNEGEPTLLRKVREDIVRGHQAGVEWVRESPTKAMLGAIAVGYILHLLPLRAILITKARVISVLARPALLLFGAVKLYEFLKGQNLGKR